MKILLTGYTGFIGSKLLAELLIAHHQVVCLGRRPPPLARSSLYEYVKCDLADNNGMEQVDWAGLDVVIHLASAGVKAAHRFWPECLATNIVGQQNLLSWVAQYKNIKKIIIAGTFYEKIVYENPVLWDNPYVATKWTASESFKAWAQHAGCISVLLHFFQVYGPGDESGNVLSYTKNSLRSGLVAKLGGGKSRRDWIYLDDAVGALMVALTNLSADPGFSAYDVGSGELHSIRETVEFMATRIGASPDLLEFDAKRDRHDAGVELAAQRFLPGWNPVYNYKAGLTQFSTT
ncbi:MAG: NAD(P)-dependent oxidoreductase [Opitutus sp.]|nr:NAD(P)-dependent oxidoreductase [Opitutus sp.]MCS6274343.1 NAD(P)-dependent oxidoreductase [Opitutus sp.]MCS6300792.1 NAD(P)-dependent oxidoreductase [Opitutus sp.]